MLECMQVLQCGAAQWCCSAMLLCGVECGEQDFAQVLQLKHVLQCVVKCGAQNLAIPTYTNVPMGWLRLVGSLKL